MISELPPKLKTSVVIRCKNESRTYREVLNQLFKQTLMSFELIIVDNSSTDDTLKLLGDYPVATIIHVPDEEFNHAYTCNLGVYVAKTNFVVLTNGHCLPISNTWLEDGLSNFSEDDVAAIDGNYRSGRTASKWERLGDIWQADTLNVRRENLPITTTNAIIRRDLWVEYPFDESLPECEDYDWSQEMIARGYRTIKDPRFNVYHSHNLKKKQIDDQNARWAKVCRSIDRRRRTRRGTPRVSDTDNCLKSKTRIERLL